jgi:hypothetical protein
VEELSLLTPRFSLLLTVLMESLLDNSKSGLELTTNKYKSQLNKGLLPQALSCTQNGTQPQLTEMLQLSLFPALSLLMLVPNLIASQPKEEFHQEQQ